MFLRVGRAGAVGGACRVGGVDMQSFRKWPAGDFSNLTLNTQDTHKRAHTHTPAVPVGSQFWVNVKEHGHVHRLPGAQPLLLKAKALDLLAHTRFFASVGGRGGGGQVSHEARGSGRTLLK